MVRMLCAGDGGVAVEAVPPAGGDDVMSVKRLLDAEELHSVIDSTVAHPERAHPERVWPDEPAARLDPQLLVCPKSPLLVPVTAMLVIDSAALPEFERVTA